MSYNHNIKPFLSLLLAALLLALGVHIVSAQTNNFNNVNVNGRLRITSGTPAFGKVLTSDAAGVATWQPATGGGGSIAINDTVAGAKNGGVLFTATAGILQQDSALFNWNNTDKRLIVGGEISPTSSVRAKICGAGTTSSTFGLQVHNSTGANNALIVRDDGRVGIGVSAPNGLLQISGAGELLRLSNGATGIIVNTASGLVFRGVSNHFVRFQDYLSVNQISYDLNGVTLHNSVSALGNFILTSTTGGLRLSLLTTVQRDSVVSPQAGLMIYNTTTNRPNFFNGTNWVAL